MRDMEFAKNSGWCYFDLKTRIKWFTKFIVNYIVNNNRTLSKSFDVYNTIEIKFQER